MAVERKNNGTRNKPVDVGTDTCTRHNMSQQMHRSCYQVNQVNGKQHLEPLAKGEDRPMFRIFSELMAKPRVPIRCSRGRAARICNRTGALQHYRGVANHVHLKILPDWLPTSSERHGRNHGALACCKNTKSMRSRLRLAHGRTYRVLFMVPQITTGCFS